MGWLLSALLGTVTFVLLAWAARADRALVQLFAAALFLGVAGYTWQGHPGLAGHSSRPAETAGSTGGLFAVERRAWMERMGPDAQALDTADAFISRGDADYAIGILRGEIGRRPRRPMLWMGLGNALVRYADGQVTPAARYAFARAEALDPRDPAPDYLLGLAMVEAGDPAAAIAAWQRALTKPMDEVRRQVVRIRMEMLQRIAG